MTAASGPITRPMAGYAWLIANCPEFQTALSVEDAEAALAKVFWPEVDFDPDDPDEPIPERPFCVVTHDEECQWNFDANTGRSWGELKVSFEFPISSEVNEKSSEATSLFCNSVGLIILQMGQLSNQPDGSGKLYPNLGLFTQTVAPGRCSYKENPKPNIPGNFFMGATYKIAWVP